MAVTPELLRALSVGGDLANVPIRLEREEDVLPPIDRDPSLRLLIDSGVLDPQVQSALIAEDDQRIREKRIRQQIDLTEQRLAGEDQQSKEREGILAFLGPVPVGLQVGTFLGIENSFWRLVVDIVADPISFISGGAAIGGKGLTKLGMAAAKLTKKGNRLTAFQKARARDLVRGGKSAREAVQAVARPDKIRTPTELSQDLMEGARVMGRAGIRPDEAKELKEAFEAFDFKRAAPIIKKFKKNRLTNTELEKLRRIDPDLAALLSNEKQELAGLKAAFTKLTRNERLEESTSFLDAVSKGQRAFLTFGVPFTDKQFGSLKFQGIIKSLISGRAKEASVQAAKDTPGFLKGLIARGSPHLEDGLNIADSAAVQGKYSDLVTETVDLVSGDLTKRKYTKRYISSGENLNASVTGELEMATINSRELGAAVDVVVPNPEIREQMNRIMQNPQTPDLINDPRFQALPKEAQKMTLETQRLLREMGRQGVEQHVIRDMADNYVTRLVRVKRSDSKRAMAMLRRTRGSEKFLDKKVLKKLKKGDPISIEEGRDVLSAIFQSRLTAKGRKFGGSRFSFERAFETLEDLEEFIKLPENSGVYEIITKDIGKIIPVYVENFGHATIRNRLLLDAQEARVMDNELSGLFKNRAGKEVSINRAVIDEDFINTLTKEAQDRVADRFVKLRGLEKFWVHKDLRAGLAPIYEKDAIREFTRQRGGATHAVAEGLINTNNVLKTMLFTLNPFFHATALTMSNLAIMPPLEALRAGVQSFRFMKYAYTKNPQAASELILKTMSRTVNTAGAMQADDIIREMKLSGLKLSRFEEIEEGFSAIQSGLRRAADAITNNELMKSPITGLIHFNSMNDKMLWQVVQNTYKTNAWVHIRQAELKRYAKTFGKEAAGADLAKINAEAANISNQAFGGLAWERYAITPTGQRALRLGLLAPDWTFANLLMGRDLFVNIPGVRQSVIGKALTRDVLLSDMRFRWALQYNMRAALFGFVGANLMNYAFTHYKNPGKGKWLHENDQEAFDEKTRMKSRIEMPWTTDDGRRQFMDISRQFTEPWAALVNPLEVTTRKLGVLPKAAKTIMTSTDAFGRPIAGAEDGPFAKMAKTLWTATGQFEPISIQQIQRVFSGQLPTKAAAFSIAGFPVRTESQKTFDRRQRLEELKRALVEEHSR
jgi:hypothetical protein